MFEDVARQGLALAVVMTIFAAEMGDHRVYWPVAAMGYGPRGTPLRSPKAGPNEDSRSIPIASGVCLRSDARQVRLRRAQLC